MLLGSYSGGPLYHLKAALYSHALWDSHRQSVAQFLTEWNPKNKQLVLIGPSGGYSLPKTFFKRFQSIVAFEPDPVARAIFERRFSFKPEWSGAYSVEKSLPEGSVLFCNLLGQIEMNAVEFKLALLQQIKGREFASYHDIFSGSKMDFHPSFKKKPTEREVQVCIASRSKRGKDLLVQQHEAFDLFTDPSFHYRYWQWKLTSNRTHLIEGVFQSG